MTPLKQGNFTFRKKQLTCIVERNDNVIDMFDERDDDVIDVFDEQDDDIIDVNAYDVSRHGVNLCRLYPPRMGDIFPVWRIAICREFAVWMHEKAIGGLTGPVHVHMSFSTLQSTEEWLALNSEQYLQTLYPERCPAPFAGDHLRAINDTSVVTNVEPLASGHLRRYTEGYFTIHHVSDALWLSRHGELVGIIIDHEACDSTLLITQNERTQSLWHGPTVAFLLGMAEQIVRDMEAQY